jgi:hypothetical protein
MNTGKCKTFGLAGLAVVLLEVAKQGVARVLSIGARSFFIFQLAFSLFQKIVNEVLAH